MLWLRKEKAWVVNYASCYISFVYFYYIIGRQVLTSSERKSVGWTCGSFWFRILILLCCCVFFVFLGNYYFLFFIFNTYAKNYAIVISIYRCQCDNDALLLHINKLSLLNIRHFSNFYHCILYIHLIGHIGYMWCVCVLKILIR